MKNIEASFRFVKKSKLKLILPELYDILYINMSTIAPTGKSYEEDKNEWMSCVAPALEREQRQIILIYDRHTLAGYFQYYINNGVFMMEEIQFKPEYQGSGLFGQLYRYLTNIIIDDIEFVEAYANKRNKKSQAILKHLGLEVIGENKNGNSLHFKGCYNALVKRFHHIGSLFCEKAEYIKNKNTFHFILDDNDRPAWSKALERSYIETGESLDMAKNYQKQRDLASKNIAMRKFFSYITESGGVIVDLASGPSGYFSSALDLLKSGSLFVATDACPTVISAHANANNLNNFYLLDIDLDQSLPFKDKSIDAFSGNLLDNVNNYRGLIKEAYRCLKTGGRFAVIEFFTEKGNATYHYLIEHNAVYSSIDTFKEFCEGIGFEYLGGDLLYETTGKKDSGDLLPICEGDKSVIRTAFFKKQQ